MSFGSFTFHVVFFFPLSLPRNVPYFTVYMSYTEDVVLCAYQLGSHSIPNCYLLEKNTSIIRRVYQLSWLFHKRVVHTKFDIIVESIYF